MVDRVGKTNKVWPEDTKSSDESIMSDEKIAYIHGLNERSGDTEPNHADSTDAIVGEDRTIGQILIEANRLSHTDASRIIELQKREGLFFGEAAKKLNLLTDEDITYALSKQFDYPYLRLAEGIFSQELIAAYEPFTAQAEALRAIRSQILLAWQNQSHKALAVVSPGEKEGRSYLAANLAVTFAQLGKKTLLMDGDLRNPRQHQIFDFNCRVGLSSMLAGRIKREDLEKLPESVPFFTHLSVLGAGAVPPNPLELLAGDRFPRIMSELNQYYDVVIIDTPAGGNQADFQPLAVAASNALLVVRKNHTKIADIKRQMATLSSVRVNVMGAVLSDF